MEPDAPGGAGSAPGQSGSSLPVSRSFVVQFTSDTAPTSQCFRGRVEHIDSGRSQRFDSLDNLVAFLTEALEANESEEQG